MDLQVEYHPSISCLYLRSEHLTVTFIYDTLPAPDNPEDIQLQLQFLNTVLMALQLIALTAVVVLRGTGNVPDFHQHAGGAFPILPFISMTNLERITQKNSLNVIYYSFLRFLAKAS